MPVSQLVTCCLDILFMWRPSFRKHPVSLTGPYLLQLMWLTKQSRKTGSISRRYQWRTEWACTVPYQVRLAWLETSTLAHWKLKGFVINNCIFQVWREMLNVMALVHERFVGENWNQSPAHTYEGFYRFIFPTNYAVGACPKQSILLVLIDITSVLYEFFIWLHHQSFVCHLSRCLLSCTKLFHFVFRN